MKDSIKRRRMADLGSHLAKTIGKTAGKIVALLVVASPSVVAGDRHYDATRGWGESAPLIRSDGVQVPGGCPIESPGGQFLFTARNPGTGLDLYVNQRVDRQAAFDPGHALPTPVNDPGLGNDFCPTPLNDGELYFVSARAGGCGSGDLQRTTLNPATGYAAPGNLGCIPDGPNTPGLELSPSVIETRWGTYLFFSTDYYSGNQDIYVSKMRKDGTFGPGVALPYPVNTEFDDRQPNVSQNGRELVFASNRPSDAGDDTGFDIFSAQGSAKNNRWRRVVNLSEQVPFESVEDNETRPSMSWDRKRLVYGAGGVWVSERR